MLELLRENALRLAGEGEAVAAVLKVQHPHVASRLMIDIYCSTFLAVLLGAVAPHLRAVAHDVGVDASPAQRGSVQLLRYRAPHSRWVSWSGGALFIRGRGVLDHWPGPVTSAGVLLGGWRWWFGESLALVKISSMGEARVGNPLLSDLGR